MSHYLGEIYRLGGLDQDVSTSDLAEVMLVTPAAVTRMVSRLEESGYVEREPYRGVRLTGSGELEALKEIRRHRLAEAFLVTVMGYGWHEAHDMADALAEVADEFFVERMDAVAGYPKTCPHGEPIPTADGRMPQVNDEALSHFEVEEPGVISRVKVRDEARLEYLAQVGVTPGVSFTVEGKSPFEGPIRLRIGQREQVLGAELAGKIRARRLGG